MALARVLRRMMTVQLSKAWWTWRQWALTHDASGTVIRRALNRCRLAMLQVAVRRWAARTASISDIGRVLSKLAVGWKRRRMKRVWAHWRADAVKVSGAAVALRSWLISAQTRLTLAALTRWHILTLKTAHVETRDSGRTAQLGHCLRRIVRRRTRHVLRRWQQWLARERRLTITLRRMLCVKLGAAFVQWREGVHLHRHEEHQDRAESANRANTVAGMTIKSLGGQMDTLFLRTTFRHWCRESGTVSRRRQRLATIVRRRRRVDLQVCWHRWVQAGDRAGMHHHGRREMSARICMQSLRQSHLSLLRSGLRLWQEWVREHQTTEHHEERHAEGSRVALARGTLTRWRYTILRTTGKRREEELRRLVLLSTVRAWSKHIMMMRHARHVLAHLMYDWWIVRRVGRRFREWASAARADRHDDHHDEKHNLKTQVGEASISHGVWVLLSRMRGRENRSLSRAWTTWATGVAKARELAQRTKQWALRRRLALLRGMWRGWAGAATTMVSDRRILTRATSGLERRWTRCALRWWGEKVKHWNDAHRVWERVVVSDPAKRFLFSALHMWHSKTVLWNDARRSLSMILASGTLRIKRTVVGQWRRCAWSMAAAHAADAAQCRYESMEDQLSVAQIATRHRARDVIISSIRSNLQNTLMRTLYIWREQTRAEAEWDRHLRTASALAGKLWTQHRKLQIFCALRDVTRHDRQMRTRVQLMFTQSSRRWQVAAIHTWVLFVRAQRAYERVSALIGRGTDARLTRRVFNAWCDDVREQRNRVTFLRVVIVHAARRCLSRPFIHWTRGYGPRDRRRLAAEAEAAEHKLQLRQGMARRVLLLVVRHMKTHALVVWKQFDLSVRWLHDRRQGQLEWCLESWHAHAAERAKARRVVRRLFRASRDLSLQVSKDLVLLP